MIDIFEESYNTGDMRYLQDKFTVDGDYLNQPKGILNFYSGGMDPALVQKCLNAIKYLLGEYGAKLTGPITKDISRLYETETYRFPVSVENKENIAPELNVTNMAAQKIVQDMLQMHGEDVYAGSVSVSDLLFKLGSLSGFSIQNMQTEPEVSKNSYSFGFDEERLQRYINELTRMAVWAKEHEYDTITWS